MRIVLLKLDNPIRILLFEKNAFTIHIDLCENNIYTSNTNKI